LSWLAPLNGLTAGVLDGYFGGIRDERTLQMLALG
jgi:uncharacterized protein (DUF1810 family)